MFPTRSSPQRFLAAGRDRRDTDSEISKNRMTNPSTPGKNDVVRGKSRDLQLTAT
jgi:hypothetical protein